jgi:hypothetical protein
MWTREGPVKAALYHPDDNSGVIPILIDDDLTGTVEDIVAWTRQRA